MSPLARLPVGLSRKDAQELRRAKELLEHQGFAIRVANTLGASLEGAGSFFPAPIRAIARKASHIALRRAIDAATISLHDDPQRSARIWRHKAAVIGTGIFGGLGGPATLAVELPLTTTIMLRSIAEIARSEGESVRAVETKLACLHVFALGGPTSSDDSGDTGYLATRLGLSSMMKDASSFLGRGALTTEGAPMLLRLVSAIAERFSVQVSEKVLAQSLPIIGAAGGAAINALFIDHFQKVARGHFVVRRLERQYGMEEIQERYRGL